MATVKKIPQRQCIGCGQMKDKKDLIRILKTQDESIVIDATGRKNGRGAYICANEDCLSKAFKNKGLERSFKMAVDSAVYDELAKELNNTGRKSGKNPDRGRRISGGRKPGKRNVPGIDPVFFVFFHIV